VPERKNYVNFGDDKLLKNINKKWEYAKDIYACFDELKKAFKRALREKL